MDVLTQIEQRVPLQALAHDVVFNPNDVKLSHVAWLVHCILRGAGAPASADDVWQAMKGGDLSQDDITAVLQYAITEIYGSGPENPGKKPKAKAKKKAIST